MSSSWRSAPATRVILRSVVLYVALAVLATMAWEVLPRGNAEIPSSLDALFGKADAVSKQQSAAPLDEGTLAFTMAVAMAAASLLSLPVAWIYQLTRAKRGYQQSVVQLLIILPTVVSGIVLLVKYSVTLAFSLAGIVAAVRFRNSLDDSKDAVYVFLATGLGLAAAVNMPVAFVLSVGFNVLILALWFTDFGHAVELDGRLAEKRLARAKQMARTGTFVARMDEEVLRNMTTEQLEGLAERAFRRAKANNMTTEMPVVFEERTLRLTTSDPAMLRRVLEPRLAEHTKTWRFGGMQTADGTTVLEYRVQLKKKTGPEELLSLVRATGASQLEAAELE
ncbi:MAG: DUF4956 domain-containing protein [Gemmatimonadaceae bacterium]|nr:DUF4956 domain-containing protein [Gemmatimonadaceae bacterium]